MMPSRNLRIRRNPADDSCCGWLEQLPELPPPRRVVSPVACHFAVIGAGFTGLAAARRLAELHPGARIVVLEAQRVGFGASGRSSGFLVDLASFIAAMPKTHAERYIRLSRAGIADLRRLVRRFDIDCDWDGSGFLHAAASDSGCRSLEHLSDWLAERGEPFQTLDGDGVEEVTGTSFYRAAIRLPGSVTVQAGALVRGLATNLPASVEIFEDSPVGAIENGEVLKIMAGESVVHARQAILAINGYAPALGVLATRVFPLLTFGSLTRRLTTSEQDALRGETAWGILAQDPMGSSVRRTRDQRLLIRNYVHYQRDLLASSRQRNKAVSLHRLALRRRFPQLAAIDFEHTWSGVMGISKNSFPFFGHLAPNLSTAAGFTACGIAMGTTSGRLLADQMSGIDSDLLNDRLRLPGPSWFPPEPFLSVGLPLVMAHKNATAGAAL